MTNFRTRKEIIDNHERVDISIKEMYIQKGMLEVLLDIRELLQDLTKSTP